MSLDGATTDELDDSTETVCCTASHSLSETDLREDVRLLSAVGNETRYETLRYVDGAGAEGACVCELPPLVGVTQSTVSNALSRLYEAGLVDRRKEGRWRYYTSTEAAEQLLGMLDGRREVDGE